MEARDLTIDPTFGSPHATMPLQLSVSYLAQVYAFHMVSTIYLYLINKSTFPTVNFICLLNMQLNTINEPIHVCVSCRHVSNVDWCLSTVNYHSWAQVLHSLDHDAGNTTKPLKDEYLYIYPTSQIIHKYKQVQSLSEISPKCKGSRFGGRIDS